MRRLVFVLFTGIVSCLSGCRSTNNSDLIEAELRARSDELRKARSNLDRTQAYNEYLQRELRHTRRNCAGKSTPPGISTSTAVLKVELARQTGGYDKDGIPGDEMLQVVLEPTDADGHGIKAPGRLEVHALDINKEGLKKPICSWLVDEDELRRSWRSGLLSTGYFIRLPWKNWPTSRKVRVVVRFLTTDQRLFEADRDVTVRLLPAMLRKSGPTPHAATVPHNVMPHADEPIPIPAPPAATTSQPKPKTLPAPEPEPEPELDIPEETAAPPIIEEEVKTPPTVSTSKKTPTQKVKLLLPVPY